MYTLEKIKNMINEAHVYSLDDLPEELFDVVFEFIETLETDEHRWYVIDTDVYKVMHKGLHVGFLGITEVGTIKSEMMTDVDCGVEVHAFYVRQIMKPSFEICEEGE